MLAALAGWRLAFLLSREDGPWQVFARLRDRTGKGMLGRLLSCVKCLGMWTAIPLAFFVGGNWTELVVIWLALSAVTALIDETIRPPFEWHEAQDDELLRTGTDHTDD